MDARSRSEGARRGRVVVSRLVPHALRVRVYLPRRPTGKADRTGARVRGRDGGRFAAAQRGDHNALRLSA